jgi:N6-adenosine-specific RNA methylase IME4
MVLTTIDQLWQLAASGQRFGTIYCDPPWRYEKCGKKGAALTHYNTMRLEEIAEIPVYSLSKRRSHLHLWTTTSFLKEALWLMEKWGFDYKSQLIWCKPTLGTGNYYRVSHEILLLGARGRLPFEDHSIKSWQVCSRGRHSEKPHFFRELIEKASPLPRLELFAREVRDGWTVFGDEFNNNRQIEGGLFETVDSDA